MVIGPLGDSGNKSSSSIGERMGTAFAAILESRPQWLGMSVAIIAVKTKHIVERPFKRYT